MGDRTSVTLMVLKEQQAATEAILKDDIDKHEDTLKPFVYYYFYEVNYGNLGYCDELEAAGIAFDSSWDHGSEYGPGTDYCRFLPDGTVWRAEISDSFVNPRLDALLERIDDPETLRAFILDHQKEVTPPSWDNQLAYSKLYLTKKLIST